MSDKTLCLLTDDELVHLDGKCRSEIQEKVSAAMTRVTVANGITGAERHIAVFVGALVQEAHSNGMLTMERTSIYHCPLCERRGEYARYRRSGRHHKKGDVDRSHQERFGAYEFAKRFFGVIGSVAIGCCLECWEKARPFAADALEHMQAEIPEAITGHPPRWKKYNNRQCTKCDWTGHEGQMGKRRTMMGDGWYPAVCPQCDAENMLFTSPVKIADGFRVVAAVQPQEAK